MSDFGGFYEGSKWRNKKRAGQSDHAKQHHHEDGCIGRHLTKHDLANEKSEMVINVMIDAALLTLPKIMLVEPIS